jgi:hypothetical protein
MLETRHASTRVEPVDLRPESKPAPAPVTREGPGLLVRLFWVGVGFGVMLTGFALMLSVFVAFLGLPLFVFGLALVQSQDR